MTPHPDNQHFRDDSSHKRHRAWATTLALLGILVLPRMVRAADDFDPPPVPDSAVVAGILAGGGPDVAGIIEPRTEANNTSPSHNWMVRVDAEGRPTTKKGAEYLCFIRLSVYFSRRVPTWRAEVRMIHVRSRVIVHIGTSKEVHADPEKAVEEATADYQRGITGRFRTTKPTAAP